MKLLYTTIIILLGALLIPRFSQGQAPTKQNLLSHLANMEKYHEQEFGDLRDVISGREHRAVYHYTIGHPFWKQKSWVLGDVQTTLHYYPALTIRYDLYKDALLYLPDSLSVDFMAVNQNQVLYFNMEDVTFVNLGMGEELQAMNEIDMPRGYYRWVYKGECSFFVKNRKELKSKSGDVTAHSEFYDKRSSYLYINNKFHLIKKKKNVLQALADHKTEVRAYMRKQNVRVRKINDLQFAELLRYYDSL